MQTRLKLFGIVLLTFFAFSSFLTMHSVVGQTNSADSKMQAANDAVNKAFNDVLAAEKAGANVTSLLVQLNGADGLLAQAEVALRSGDSATAIAKAESTIPIAQQVSSLAANEESNTGVAHGISSWFLIEFSVIGSVVFVLVLFLAWGRLKNNYVKKLSDAKPELTQQ